MDEKQTIAEAHLRIAAQHLELSKETKRLYGAAVYTNIVFCISLFVAIVIALAK